MRKKRNRAKFKNANMISGESLYLFSTRLEMSFRIAHPHHDPKKNSILREKFVSPVPKIF